MIDGLFDKYYEILSVAVVSDGKGGSTETITVASTVKGRLVDVSGFESFRFQKIQAEITNRLYCPYSTVISRTNRIREKDTTVVYQVVDYQVGELGLNKHKEIDLRRITNS